MAELLEDLEAHGARVTDVSLDHQGAKEVTVDLSMTVDIDPDGVETAVPTRTSGPVPENAESENRDGKSNPAESREPTTNRDVETDECQPTEKANGQDSPQDGDPVTSQNEEPTPTEEPEESGQGKSPDRSSAEAAETEGIPCPHEDCSDVFASEHGMKIHVGKVHGSDGGLAPHRDPDRLKKLYSSHDTFEEMAAALGGDVSAQTIRRHAISQGIHVPGEGGTDELEGQGEQDPAGNAVGDGDSVESANSEEEPVNAESSDPVEQRDEEAASPVSETELEGSEVRAEASEAQTDGSSDEASPDSPPESESTGHPSQDQESGQNPPEHPEESGHPDEARPGGPERGDETHPPKPTEEIRPGVTVRDLRSAVESASTIYEVQRALDVDREEALDILEETELLDLVTGRAANKRQRDQRKTEIDQLLQSAL